METTQRTVYNSIKMNYTSKVISNEKIGSKIYKTLVDTPDGFEFKAGQFVNFKVKDNMRRSYSITSAPGEEGLLFYTDISPNGIGSKFFMGLKEGDEVEFLGPLGRFTYMDNEMPMILIGTGTGIAPLYSISVEALRNFNIKKEIKLIFGLRFEEDIFLKEELENLQKEFSNFEYAITLSKPGKTWKGLKGRVTNCLHDYMTEDEVDAYICGGQDMIHSVEELLLDKGVPQDNIFYEKYY